jgi:hypothetical protein
MNALEKKLASAIEELIGQVIGLHPDLKKPLAKIQRVLRKMGRIGRTPWRSDGLVRDPA